MAPSDPADGPVASFLGQRGAVALLCEINAEGSRFSELAEALEVSRSTVSSRLQAAVDCGLLATVETDGRSHVYTFTDRGAALRVVLNQRGVTEQYRQLSRLQREFGARTAGIEEWITDGDHDLLSSLAGADPQELLKNHEW